MRDEELLDPFSSFMDHVVQHVDDVAVLAIVLHGDLVDGVLELLVVPGDVRDILLDVDIPFFELLHDISFFELLLLRDGDIPFSSFSNHLSYPLSSLSIVVPLSDFMILSIVVPLSDILGRGGDDGCRGGTGRAMISFGR